MVVTKNNIISIYYIVTDLDGNEIDSNKEFEPLQYLHGGENILPSIDAALEGAVINEEREVTLEPHQAYGDYNDQLIVSVNKEKFPAHLGHPEQGMIVDIDEGGEMIVIALKDDKVILDGNHPMAGKTLHFSVKVVSVREATTDELQQKHPLTQQKEICGPGCCC